MTHKGIKSRMINGEKFGAIEKAFRKGYCTGSLTDYTVSARNPP